MKKKGGDAHMAKAKGARNNARPVGRPRVPQAKRVRKNDLFPEQWEELQKIAYARKVPVAAIHREAVDWYLMALARARSGSVATPEQDKAYEELVAQNRR